MNIMLFSKICAKTGVGNHIKELSEELTRQGHRVIIVSGKNDSGENTGDIVRIMSDYINNSEKYRENTEKAYQYARKYFTVKTMTEKTAEVYHGVCRRQKTDKRS